MQNFPKIIPVFPISNFIIFPKTTVPLNIFEQRYIEMINNSMKSNKYIGMIQPKNKQNNEIQNYTILVVLEKLLVLMRQMMALFN